MIKPKLKKNVKEEILQLSGALFATFGYDRVSMRDVALVTGITPAGLYYYFSTKEELYLEAVEHEFKEKTAELVVVLNESGSPWMRLELFIKNFTHLVATDENFLRLMQWVRLDSEEARQQRLTEYVFKDLFIALRDLIAELDSRYDSHMLAMSVFGLVVFSFEAGLLRKLMPGHRSECDNPVLVAEHVINLLRSGLSKPEEKAF